MIHTMLESTYTTYWVIYCTFWIALLFISCAHCGSQVAAFVLHCETVFWGHVQRLSRHSKEVQLLDEDCQEEEDFMSCNDFADAAALSHAKNHYLLPFQLVNLSAISAQEAVWVEGRRIFPQLTEMWRERRNKICCTKNMVIQRYRGPLSIRGLISFSWDKLGAGSKWPLL